MARAWASPFGPFGGCDQLKAPRLEPILEVPQEVMLVLVEHNGGGGVLGVHVDDAVVDAGASHSLANQLGDIDELNARLCVRSSTRS